MFKIVAFIPASHLTEVKVALFHAGAGKIGHYDQCCWQTLGEGQFRPLDGSKPHLGYLNALEVVDEYRVEMVCSRACLTDAIAALKHAHPYEEPAFEVYETLDVSNGKPLAEAP